MANKTTIYLVRHGQTEWNVEHRLQGHQDSPLTQQGVRQAEWLAESLQHEPIDLICTSSSGRARKTAEIIRGAREAEPIAFDDFKEINLGVWEGKTQDEAKALDAEQFHYFWNDPGKFGVEGSETFHDVLARATGKLGQIISDNPGKSLLVVTHTVVVKLVMAYFENRPLHKLWDLPYIHPACLCKVEVEGDHQQIVLHGDISHYKEEAGW